MSIIQKALSSVNDKRTQGSAAVTAGLQLIFMCINYYGERFGHVANIIPADIQNGVLIFTGAMTVMFYSMKTQKLINSVKAAPAPIQQSSPIVIEPSIATEPSPVLETQLPEIKNKIG